MRGHIASGPALKPHHTATVTPTCRADHAPLAVVQLAGLGDLALPPNGGVDAPEMGEGGGVGQAVQHLRHARPHLARTADHAPVARCQGVPAGSTRQYRQWLGTVPTAVAKGR